MNAQQAGKTTIKMAAALLKHFAKSVVGEDGLGIIFNSWTDAAGDALAEKYENWLNEDRKRAALSEAVRQADECFGRQVAGRPLLGDFRGMEPGEDDSVQQALARLPTDADDTALRSALAEGFRDAAKGQADEVYEQLADIYHRCLEQALIPISDQALGAIYRGIARIEVKTEAQTDILKRVEERLTRIEEQLRGTGPVRVKRDLREWQTEHLAQAAQEFGKKQQQLREQLANPTYPDRPYKGLNYFDFSDRAIFFGREAVAEELAAKLLRPEQRLTILHAPSGAGKTSLIRAGLIPRLLAKGCNALWATPIPYPASLYEPIAGLVPLGPEFDDVPLRDFLGAVTRALSVSPNSPLVVFIDQFERAVEPGANVDQSSLERDLAACAQATDDVLPVRLVMAIRWDFVGPLHRFRCSLPSVLDHLELLDSLGPAQAREAIMRPAEGWGVRWQPEAAQAVIDYLAKGKIEAPHLELICDQLFEQAERDRHSDITLADAQAHDLEELHREYLRREMARLSDPELGWAVLKRLVTSAGLGQARLQADIVTALGAGSGDVVDRLVDRHVLRRKQVRIGKELEIAHETLAQEIQAHESPAEIRAKAARELIGRGLDDWLGRKDLLLSIDRLRILDEYRNVLALPLLGQEVSAERNRQALEYLFRSALAAEHEVPYWFSLAESGSLDVVPIVQELLTSQSHRERAAAATTAGSVRQPTAASMRAT